ncbi:MAG: sugar ABC transporter permease [Lachnospiraceae bacterium]|nr:sugar ABC transporter permease [Lachnospiraceae bacterium]
MSDLRRKKGFKLFLFLLPGLIYVFVFKYLPLWGWAYAFVNYVPGKKLLNCDWVWFKNFKVLFGNPILRKNLFQSLTNTLGMHFISYLFRPLPMLFAIFLNELPGRRFKKVVQTASTLPHFISWVIMYALATSMLSTSGLVNSLMLDWGVIEKPLNILTTDKHVWLTQELLGIWKGLGWSSIVYFAAIAGIDQELYDAAKVDGAGRMARIRYITIPHLMPTFVVLLVMSIGNMLSTGVDQYYVFANAMNQKYITTFDLYVYNLGIADGKISYGVAVGGMKSIIAIILFSIANYISKRVRGQGIA